MGVNIIRNFWQPKTLLHVSSYTVLNSFDKCVKGMTLNLNTSACNVHRLSEKKKCDKNSNSTKKFRAHYSRECTVHDIVALS